MEQPVHDLRSFAPTAAQATGQRTVAFIVVGIMHVGLVWALIAGLASGFIQRLPDEIVAEVVKPKDEVKPPPPPPPDLAKPPPPFVPPPEINIATDAPAPTAITAVQSTIPVAPPAPAPVLTASKAVGRTHDCMNMYPALSVRLNETGDVLVSYDIGVDGAISNVTIAKGSGSERLDQATVSCVSTKFRNTPAMNGNTPVASHSQTLIRWTLKGR